MVQKTHLPKGEKNKIMIKKLLFSTVLMLTSFWVFAQPDIDHSQHGCHYFQNREAIAAAMTAIPPPTGAINERSDTIDVLHYDITLDVTEYGGKIQGITKVTFTPLMDGLTSITLDLEGLTVDSVWNDGGMPMNYTQRVDTFLTTVFFDQPLGMNDTASVTLAYGGFPITCPSGFGGFYYEDQYAYNLSIGLAAYPHNFGRAWFPCFDNFQERSFYTWRVITPSDRMAKASGEFVESIDMSDNRTMWVYEMNKPLPTYLASVAAAKYAPIRWTHTGEYGDVPIEIMARPADSVDVKFAFANLSTAIGTFEDWYGEMIWSSVGYSMATRGAMEDPNNIIYPQFAATDGNTNDRLMAHELCHQWWGNAVNPKTSMDMWIKEGNAEYGAHLFFEKLDGQKVFENVVSDNLAEVLKTAHIVDGQFRALSPMPPTHTYGPHTYNKGASMLHNMRAYMGDSLFEYGQKEVLAAFEFQPMDAYEYRDQLTASTGVDMKDYFDAWIFAPGFSNFEIDKKTFAPSANGFEATLDIQQKLRGTTVFHDNIPLFITFLDEQLNEFTEKVMMSGEFMTFTVQVPFEPEFVFINFHQEMNMARLQEARMIDDVTTFTPRNTSFQVEVQNVGNPTFLNIVHHWTAPDAPDPIDNPFDARFSNTHYWSVRGNAEADFSSRGLIGFSDLLDEDLIANGKDSLILAWRPNEQSPWVEHPNYRKFVGPSRIFINDLLMGDYTFANGSLNVVSTEEPSAPQYFTEVYPNPASEQVNFKGYSDDLRQNQLTIQITDALGRLALTANADLVQGQFDTNVNISSLTAGIYFSNILSENGEVVGVERLVVK